MSQTRDLLRLHAEIRRTRPPWMLQGLLIGVIIALLGPAVSLAIGWDPVWLHGASAGWRMAHLASLHTDSGVVAGVLVTQAAIVFGATLLWRWIAPRLPRRLVPTRWLVDVASLSAFKDRGLDEAGRDVLLYVDVPRRAARIVAGRQAIGLIADEALAAAQTALADGSGIDPEGAVSDAADILKRAT